MGEDVNPLSGFNKHLAIFGHFRVEVVVFVNIGWKIAEFYLHLFESLRGSVEIKVFDVDGD